MDGRPILSHPNAKVLGVEEALATLGEAMDRCLSVPLFARSSQQLVGYLDRLHAHQQRLAAVQAALVRELEVLLRYERGRELCVGRGSGSDAVLEMKD